MKTFKQYLKNCNRDVREIKTFKVFLLYVHTWLNVVKKDLQIYIDQLPHDLVEHALTSFFKEIEPFHGEKPSDDLVAKIDRDFKKLLNYCGAQLIRYNKIYPFDLLIRNFPLEKDVSGVKFTCRVILGDGLAKEFDVCDDYFACASPGANLSQSDLKKYVNSQIGKISWLTESLKTLGLKHIDVVKYKKPHAEDHWFIKYSEELIEFCSKKIRGRRLPKILDELPLTHFSSSIRIEFYSSTSCCVECWPYFRALRLKLNELGIYVPILIFGYKPYQRNDMYQSVFYVSMSGDYCNPHLQWGEKSLSLIPKPKLSTFNLNVLYQQYFELEVRGRSVIPLLQANENYAKDFIKYIFRMIDYPHTNLIFQYWAIPFLLTSAIAVGGIDAEQLQEELERSVKLNQIDIGLLDLLFADVFQENLKERLKAVVNPRKSIWFFGFLFSRSLAYASVDAIEQMDQENELTQSGRDERKQSMADENNSYNGYSGLFRLSMVRSLNRLSGGSFPSDDEREAAAGVWRNIAIRRELPEIEDRIHPEEGDDEVIRLANLFKNLRQ